MKRHLPLWLGLAIGLLASCATAADDADRIQPWAENPRYWQLLRDRADDEAYLAARPGVVKGMGHGRPVRARGDG